MCPVQGDARTPLSILGVRFRMMQVHPCRSSSFSEGQRDFLGREGGSRGGRTTLDVP